MYDEHYIFGNEPADEHYIFGYGPELWDADPDVCCSAFQLGACEHTESELDYSQFSVDDDCPF